MESAGAASRAWTDADAAARVAVVVVVACAVAEADESLSRYESEPTMEAAIACVAMPIG
jgi:hypothetical protein